MTFDLNLNSMSLGNELITSGKRICKTYVKERKKKQLTSLLILKKTKVRPCDVF